MQVKFIDGFIEKEIDGEVYKIKKLTQRERVKLQEFQALIESEILEDQLNAVFELIIVTIAETPFKCFNGKVWSEASYEEKLDTLNRIEDSKLLESIMIGVGEYLSSLFTGLEEKKKESVPPSSPGSRKPQRKRK